MLAPIDGSADGSALARRHGDAETGDAGLSRSRPAGAPLTLSAQGSFFVGGRDIRSDALSAVPAYAPSGTIVVDQVYARYAVPAEVVGPPLVLVHGCCLTGQSWETTPDGRPGWDEILLRAGFPVYAVDQAWRGRSGAGIAPAVNRDGPLPAVFSAGREDAWTVFRFGPRFPEPHPDTLFPVEAAGELWRSMVPDFFYALPTPNPTVPALSALARRLGGAVLVGHSQAGLYPFQAAEAGRDGVAALVALEPAALPDPAGDLSAFRDLPVLIVYGDHVEESPRWAPRLALARTFVVAANAAGGRAELMALPERGIRGNSHMIMQDRNSDVVAGLVAAWVTRNVPATGGDA